MLNLLNIFSLKRSPLLSQFHLLLFYVLLFHVLHFHVLSFGPSISRPSFSCPAFSVITCFYIMLFIVEYCRRRSTLINSLLGNHAYLHSSCIILNGGKETDRLFRVSTFTTLVSDLIFQLEFVKQFRSCQDG